MGNITFGQYIETGSVLHKTDPRTKFLFLIAYIVLIFTASGFASLGFLALFLLVLVFMSKVPLKMYLKNIKAILPVIILTAVLNALYAGEGRVLFKFLVFKITVSGLERAGFMALRVILLIIASAMLTYATTPSAMLTYTTTPTSLANALEKLLSPLKWIGLSSAVHMVVMTMTIALRFIPILIDETNKIMNAQKARGADFESGGLYSRVKALIPILIPLFISSIRRAYELAASMECRCYTGGVGRTRLVTMRYTARDLMALFIICVAVAAVIILNITF